MLEKAENDEQFEGKRKKKEEKVRAKAQKVRAKAQADFEKKELKEMQKWAKLDKKRSARVKKEELKAEKKREARKRKQEKREARKRKQEEKKRRRMKTSTSAINKAQKVVVVIFMEVLIVISMYVPYKMKLSDEEVAFDLGYHFFFSPPPYPGVGEKVLLTEIDLSRWAVEYITVLTIMVVLLWVYRSPARNDEPSSFH